MSMRTIQSEPLVTEDLAKFIGLWVAIRNGKVIAAASEPDELFENDKVTDDDEISFVPLKSEISLFL